MKEEWAKCSCIKQSTKLFFMTLFKPNLDLTLCFNDAMLLKNAIALICLALFCHEDCDFDLKGIFKKCKLNHNQL